MITDNHFGPAGRFEIVTSLDSFIAGIPFYRLADRGEHLFGIHALPPDAFKAAAEILRREGAPLDVVERTITGERF